MGVDFKLVLNDQEQLIYHCLNLVNLTNQVSTKIQHVISTLPDLSSEGAYHDLISNNKSNMGLGLFYLKAQEFETLSNVLYRHVQNTYDKMIDTDKVLATMIAEKILNDPTSSAEDKETIKRDPKGSVEWIKQQGQEGAKRAQESGER